MGKIIIKDSAANTVVGTVRHVLNGSLCNVTPAQVLDAIQENQSLWVAAGADIEKIATLLPRSVITAGRPMYRKALTDYGNTTKLVLAWLDQDHPALYSTIINTDGGIDWFDRQVREICEKLGLDYEII